MQKNKNLKLIIFIPAFNAEKTICSVIDRIPKKTLSRCSEILVSDNHSSDNTFKVISEYKLKKNLRKLTIVRQRCNKGFGGNIKFGLQYSVNNNMDILAVLHADGQYPSDKIDALIKPIDDGKASTVSGSRFMGNPLRGGMPIWRYLGNIFLTKIENVLINNRMSEWHSGFCAYDCRVLRKIPFMDCVDGYELTTDILLLFLSNKSKIAEIPIPTHYGKDSTSPSLKRTFLYFVLSFYLAFIFFLHRTGILKIKKYSFRK